MHFAEVFRSGESQAIRFPRSFRLNAREVRIREQGARLVIEPVVSDWCWLDARHERIGKFDQDFIEAASKEPAEQSDRVAQVSSCRRLSA
jgi:antitoxin VapB